MRPRTILAVLSLAALLFFARPFSAQENNNGQATELQKKINEYQTKLGELRQQKNTLASQIKLMDTQIYLAELQIQATEQKIISTSKEIDVLGGRIDGLDLSINDATAKLVEKIREGYKNPQLDMFSILFKSANLNEMLLKIKYSNVAKENNRKFLFTVQEAKLNYEEQKQLREEKKAELDSLKVSLDNQKADLDTQKVSKQRLLADTQNNETVYQGLLSRAQAEYAAIQGIVAGGGTETMLREVKKGDTIASVIAGPSCNSSGAHLHFIVKEGSAVQNPFNYLKDVPHNDYTSGDPWSPAGSWDWPVSPAIDFNQGYGETWAVRNTWVGNIYRFHNGLDVTGTSYSVYAVADGTLYRGSYSVGCTLPYALLKHKDSNLTTLYLHTYTQ